MKIVRFLGGLGNQMFQYAFYLSLQKHFTTVKADITGFDDYTLHNGFELEQVFPIRMSHANRFEVKIYTPNDRQWIWRKLRRIYGTKNAYFQERNEFQYDGSIYEDDDNRYYWGYWQHINYLNPVEEELRKAFIFPKVKNEKTERLINTIINCNSVSVHVRRGDYLGHSILGGICDTAYYEKAINKMREQMEEPLFVFFSNDSAWCQETFRQHKAVFVDWNTGRNSFVDMYLISLCRHHIIANSSFSWWGAWLNNSAGKLVVSPSRWINNWNTDTSGLLLPTFIKV